MSTRHDRLLLTLASEFSSVETAVEEAQRFFSPYVSDEEAVYKLLLLASEAVTNGIEHGNLLDSSKFVEIIYEVDDHVATLSVEDQGLGFERSDVADPLTDEHIFDDGGRGLMLMEQIADEVKYERGGRKVVVVLRLQS